MTGTTPPADADESAAGTTRDVPVPRLGTPATESTEESQRAERSAVGDAPDTGGLTSPDHAQ